MSSRLDEHLGHVDRVLVDLHEQGLVGTNSSNLPGTQTLRGGTGAHKEAI